VALAALWCGACSSGKDLGEACTIGGDCKKGLFCCAGACVDPNDDVMNCGSCGNLCGTQHAAPHCAMGVCSITCASGFGDCDIDPKNGCEADLKSSASSCGSCSVTCMAPNTPGSCRSGTCVTGQCNTGFGDCNNNLGDGCETDLKSSADHCGRCDTACHPANGEGVCAAGKCMVTGCDAGFANCNTLPGDGCEIDTVTDDSNCGGCGNVCGAGHCVRGGCRSPDLIVFGGQDSIYSSSSTVAVSRYTLDGHQWRELDAGGLVPPARYAHAAVYDSVADRMLIWGGWTIDSNFNYDNAPPDLYALEFSGQVPLWKLLVTDAGTPPGRGSFAYAWDDANRTLWIYGGQDNSSGATMGDFWSLDVPSLTWTMHEDGGMGPRTSAVMLLDPNAGGVVVGSGSNYFGQAFADYWLWVPDAGWSTLPPDGAAPSARSSSLLMSDILYGGVNANTGNLLTDLYLVQFTDAGIAFDSLGLGGPAPKPRYYAVACSSLGEGYLLLGAVYQNFNYIDSSEVWAFDPDAGWFLQNDGDGGSYFADGDAGTDDDGGALLLGPPGTVRASCISRQ
jgi:hypothetical protein